jgi:predicted DNA-binding ribbon-helix-helix protein
MIAIRRGLPGGSHRQALAVRVLPWSYYGMKTAISLPDDLFTEADGFAVRLGMSRSQLYATALAEFLAKHRDTDVTSALNRVYRQPTLPNEVHAAASRSALRRSEWT